MSITLVGEDPELTRAMHRLEILARAEGIEFDTADYGGVRTEGDTTNILEIRRIEYAIYAERQRKAGAIPLSIDVWRPIAPYGRSHHNYGTARDVQPTRIDGVDIRRTPIAAPIWRTDPARAKQLHQKAHDRLDAIVAADPELRATLKSGDSFGDEPHFELRILLEEARRRWLARGSLRLGIVAAVLGAAGIWFMTRRRRRKRS